MIHYERYKVLLSLMRWNWQQPDWPKFTWNRSRLAQAEQQFLVGAGTLIGAVKHLDGEERSHITIETISTEAVTTAEIEGEILDRASVQSSIRRQFGLATDNRRVGPAEQGMAEMMVDLSRSFAVPLSGEMLFAWHRMLVGGRRDLKDVGRYRTSGEPIQVASGQFMSPRCTSKHRRHPMWSQRWGASSPGSTGRDQVIAILCLH
jgi:Fic family protein